MTEYSSRDNVYFNNMTDKPESHNKVCILIQRPNMYTTSPLSITEETFLSFPKLFVKNCFNHGCIPI